MAWWGSRYYDGFMAGAERAYLGRWRDELLSDVAGDVLEIGAGTGVNLLHYPPERLTSLAACEPDEGMAALLRQRLADSSPPFPVTVHEAPGERLPAPDASVDVVVSTFVLCTVEDVAASLTEVRRVLKPGGRLLFMEHVAERRPLPYAFQRGLTPLWCRFAGGCHLDRKSGEFITAAGLEIGSLDERTMKGFFGIRWPAIVGVAVR